MMEQEKLFKCGECDAKFGSLEFLQVHQRRHEMSLNLSIKSTTSSSLLTPSILTKGSLSAGIIGFIDETPTPTRFIRNCEEVGLFQDLQNVNPFDEDFKKAANTATATPSGEGNAFDFSFSTATAAVGSGLLPTTPSVSWRSKRRYSDQDSLNTPQVFPHHSIVGVNGGFQFPNLSSSAISHSNAACLTPTSHSSSIISQENLRNILQIDTPTTPTTTYNHVEHASIIAYTSAISQQTNRGEQAISKNNESPLVTPPVIVSTTGCVTPGGSNGSIIWSPPIKDKLTSPLVLQSISSKPPDSPSLCLSPSTLISSKKQLSAHKESRLSLLKNRSKPNLKLDLTTVISRSNEAKRLAAKRSDVSLEGRKNKKEQFILERKRAASQRSRERRTQWINGLESKCHALEVMLTKSQMEVTNLKAENESLKNRLKEITSSKQCNLPAASASQGENFNLSRRVDQSCQTVDSSIQVSNKPISLENANVSADIMTNIVSSIVLPTLKAKRGRPRKGQERRVPIISIPIATPGESKTLPKIPILPLARSSHNPLLNGCK